MLTKEEVAKLGSKAVETEMRSRLDELKAIKQRNGGSLKGVNEEDGGTARRIAGELNILGERLDEARAVEGVSDQYAAYEGFVGKLEDFFEKPSEGKGHPGHGRMPGSNGGAGESIRPVASMWAAMKAQRFAIGTNPRVTVSPGVLWGAVTSPTDTLAPSRRDMPFLLGADRRFIYPALRSDPLSPLDTAVDWARQSVRALATPASMRRAIAATSTKPESAFTVVLVHSALEQLAHKISGVPNIVFRNRGIATVIESDLRLGLAEALDAQAVAIINAAGMAVGGTGANLAIRIRKAMTTVQAAGFEPDTVALSPADAEALDLLLLDVLNSSNTLPNWKLDVRVGKSVTTGFVFDSKAFATVHAGPVDIAAFEENAGATNSQLVRGEFNAITTVEQVGAGAALGAQV
jgi:hypothetical protein